MAIIQKYIRPELRVALLYVFFGMVYIYFSDRILEFMFYDAEVRSAIQSIKGVGFVLITGIFFYWHTSKEIRQIRFYKNSLIENEKEVQRTIVCQVEQERNRIADELHDNVQQKIAASCLLAEALEAEYDPEMANMMNSTLHECVDDIRKISHVLSSKLIDEKNLGESISGYVSECCKRAGIHFEMQAEKGICLERDKAVAIYRITQELITNTFKHAHAGNIGVTIKKRFNKLEFSYQDDGIGCDHIPENGLGTINIKNNVRVLGGELEYSKPKKGFGIKIYIPILPLVRPVVQYSSTVRIPLFFSASNT